MLSIPRSNKDFGASDRLVFVACGVGLNVTWAIYLSYVNIYGEEFLTRRIMGWMNVSIYSAASAICAAQAMVGHHLVNRFGAKVTHGVQICAGLYALAMTLLSIPFASRVGHVCLLGVIIGIFEGGGLSALQQLAAAVDGDMTKYVNTGFTLAQAVPIGLSFLLGFRAIDHHVAAIAFAWIPLPICVAAFAHFTSAIFLRRTFDSALEQRTGLRFTTADALVDGTDLHESPQDSQADSRRLDLLSGPIGVCVFVQVASQVLSMFLMPFLTYFGSFEVARSLVLLRFGCELLGRMAAHVVGLSRLNLLDRRGLALLVLVVLMRAAILVVLLFGVFGRVNLTTHHHLALLTGSFYFLFAWSHSEVIAASAHFAPRKREAELVQLLTFFGFAGQLLSLCVALLVAERLPTGAAVAATTVAAASGGFAIMA